MLEPKRWLRLLQALYCAYRAFRLTEKYGGTGYFGLVQQGVPHMAVYLATGREAWRISQRAIEEFQWVAEEKEN